MAAVLSEEIVELVASGVDCYVATRNRELEPESMLAMGLRIHADRSVATVYLPEVSAARTIQNLRENQAIAVTICRPIDLKSIQFKGHSTEIRPSNELDRELQSVFRAALVEQLVLVGVPRSVTRRLVWWPSIAVDVRVHDVFGQTPGPSCGEPLRVV